MPKTLSSGSGSAAPAQWASVSLLLKCALLATSAALATSASSVVPKCMSHEGLPDFLAAGTPPQRARGLTFCQEYKSATCCDKGTTDHVRRVVFNMQSNQFGARCRDAWTALECSICDPRAGVLPKTAVCASTCDTLYDACAEEYFAEDAMQRLTPCRPSDTICTKLREWLTGGGEAMCKAAGYEVVSAAAAAAAGAVGGWCFEGSADAAPTGSGKGGSDTSSSSKKSGSSTSASAGKDGKEKTAKAGKGKKKGKGGSKKDADDFKQAEAWMKRMYIVFFVGLLAHFGSKALGRYLRSSPVGAARNSARLAAENRARRSNADLYL
mmetsp:Transcript_45881/g.73415  ORF Transcript_45881/g.73415 Transcript_45881/m.73415 type:complete len:325 (+) Transcript_45881:119-1093(+)